MSPNKQTIERYLDGFNKSDHAQILDCVTDDVVWIIPGMFHITGKDAFDNEIENDAFVGHPVITTTRLVEERDVVIAEGTVQAHKADGGTLNLMFCDVFEMRNTKIQKLIS